MADPPVQYNCAMVSAGLAGNDRLLAKVDEGHHTRKYSQWIRYGAVAAVLIGVIWGTLYWVTGSDKELAQHLLTQENQGVSTLATTLEDGSVVLLAKETSLLYPKHFIADKREVSLQGNAFFDVAKKQGQPFWIDTEQAKIEVLGTAFSVQSDENAPFRLSVQRGIVKVTLKKGNQLGADLIAYEGLRYYSRWFDPDGTRQDGWFAKLGYIDSKNFAHLVRCPVLFGTGLADEVCPPATQCAVYNNLTCPKRRYLFEGYGHEEIQDFDDLILDFFGREAAEL